MAASAAMPNANAAPTHASEIRQILVNFIVSPTLPSYKVRDQGE
jgi:hypothetical protein